MPQKRFRVFRFGTRSGGASNTATATVTIPRPLGTLAFTFLGWDFDPFRTYSAITSMRASDLPTGTTITVSCQGRHCPFGRRAATVTTRSRCQGGTGRCGRRHPALTWAIDLTALVKGRLTGARPWLLNQVWRTVRRARG